MKILPGATCASLLFLAACTPTAGSVESGEPPTVGAVVAPEPPVATEVACEVLAVEPSADGFATAKFRATNRGSTAVTYRGFGPDSPLYEREVLDGDRWEDDPLGWCGTGLEDQVLRPGKSVEFAVGFDRNGSSYRFKFGDPQIVTPAVSAAPN
jgi:hypothetical protein